jgi:hypothetical protein
MDPTFTPHAYFVIHAGLPKPLLQSYFLSFLNLNIKNLKVEGTKILLAGESEPHNIIGIEHPGLAGAFKSYLETQRVRFVADTETPPPLGSFKEMSIVDVRNHMNTGIFNTPYVLHGH